MTDEKGQQAASSGDEGGSFLSLVISAMFAAIWVVFWFLRGTDADGIWSLPFTIAQVAVISIVIWQVCDPFADAAQWVGERFRLPGSVRGATLDAVASSLPELFSGIFFVVVAVSAAQEASRAGDGEVTEAIIHAGAEGYGSTIATCAGSAVYNMILIPAFCALVISFTRPQRPTIDVEDEVISRDGMWFLSTQILLILFLFQEQMVWWMAVCFMALYLVYIGQLVFDARQYRRKMTFLTQHFSSSGVGARVKDVIASAQASGLKISPALVIKAQDDAENETSDDDDNVDSAGVFFGYLSIPLNTFTTFMILTTATALVAATCYYLVEATLQTARILEVPAFFVAVILAAAASSVPDTFLAIAAARRGDDSGAVSNAFGSNIFDICICLSIPLLVNSWLTGWAPVSLLQDGKPMAGLVGLRILLVVLTVVNLAIMWHNRQITRKKAIVMCGLYVVFVAYAVLGSLGIVH